MYYFYDPPHKNFYTTWANKQKFKKKQLQVKIREKILLLIFLSSSKSRESFCICFAWQPIRYCPDVCICQSEWTRFFTGLINFLFLFFVFVIYYQNKRKRLQVRKLENNSFWLRKVFFFYVVFFRFWRELTIMKVFTIYYFPVELLYLGNSCYDEKSSP